MRRALRRDVWGIAGRNRYSGFSVRRTSEAIGDLRFVQHRRGEEVLERNEVIRRVVDGAHRIQHAVRGANQADVTLRPAIEVRVGAELMVDAQEPGIFVNGGRQSVSKLIGVRRLTGVAERSVWKHKLRSTPVD